jgi:hypothetical protein
MANLGGLCRAGRVNNLKPINLQDPGVRTGFLSTRAARKVVLALLLILIVSATIAWFGVLDW